MTAYSLYSQLTFLSDSTNQNVTSPKMFMLREVEMLLASQSNLKENVNAN